MHFNIMNVVLPEKGIVLSAVKHVHVDGSNLERSRVTEVKIEVKRRIEVSEFVFIRFIEARPK